jgi:rubrerythrin
LGHECYYCDQVFDFKEKLFEHLEVHSETPEKQESKKKELKKKLDTALKKDNSHLKLVMKMNSMIKCADCGCLPLECKDSKSPKECPNCTWDECCCWDAIKNRS